MRGFYGLMGAILGAILGTAITAVVATLSAADDLSGAMDFAVFSPLGVLFGGGFGVLIGLQVLKYLQRPTAGDRGWTFFKVLLIVSLYAGTPIVSIGMVAIILSCTNNPPSDAEMIANFRRRRATFDQLLTMVQHDKKLQGISTTTTMPENPTDIGVSPARIAQYRRLLAVAGIKDGYDFVPGGGAKFDYWGIGSAISSDTFKQYVYLPKPPPALQPSLDHLSSQNLGPDGKYDTFRRIEGNWYLKYEYIPE